MERFPMSFVLLRWNTIEKMRMSLSDGIVKTLRKAGAAAMLLTAISSAAWAQYRCVENGKTLYTDRPCKTEEVLDTQPTGGAPKVIGDRGNSGYSSPYGDWRGQVQYQAIQNGQPLPGAHAVVPLVLTIEPQGKLSGISQENGCRLKGITAPGIGPNLLTVDVTLSSCQHPDFNRRLTGTIALVPAQKHVQFWVYAMPVRIGRPAQSFEIKGTLRR